MTVFMLPTQLFSAPPGPPGDSLKACIKNGDIYPHGSMFAEYIYFNRTLIRYDVYQCVDGK